MLATFKMVHFEYWALKTHYLPKKFLGASFPFILQTSIEGYLLGSEILDHNKSNKYSWTQCWHITVYKSLTTLSGAVAGGKQRTKQGGFLPAGNHNCHRKWWTILNNELELSSAKYSCDSVEVILKLSLKIFEAVKQSARSSLWVVSNYF